MNTEPKEEVVEELKEEGSFIGRFFTNRWTLTIILALIIIGIGSFVFYVKVIENHVSIDDAVISAPSIALSPTTSGILQAVYVHEGDIIPANTPVAEVGNEILKTTINSEVISVNNNIGTLFSPGQAVVTVIDPTELRVVGTLDEDKGLADIQVGQSATFTVDTFGSKKYVGVVDEISPTSDEGDVVFNISGAREVSQYDVKVRFDVNAYPELKNGMSAKLQIYK